jgi:hypothetical protein
MALGAARHDRALILQRAQSILPADRFAALLASVRPELGEADRRDLSLRFPA